MLPEGGVTFTMSLSAPVLSWLFTLLPWSITVTPLHMSSILACLAPLQLCHTPPWVNQFCMSSHEEEMAVEKHTSPIPCLSAIHDPIGDLNATWLKYFSRCSPWLLHTVFWLLKHLPLLSHLDYSVITLQNRLRPSTEAEADHVTLCETLQWLPLYCNKS
jgi:hypothetical protein